MSNAKRLRLLASFLTNGYSVMIIAHHPTSVFSATPSPITIDNHSMTDTPHPVKASTAADKARGQAALRATMANASKLSIAMAITIPLGFVTRILIPRFLGVDKAGVFFFAEAFPNIALMLLPLGIPAYIQKSVPPDHSHARVILMPVLVLQAFLALLLILTVLGYMQLVNYERQIIELTAIMAIYQTLTIFQTEVLLNIFVSVGRINLVAVINVASKLLLVALVLASLLYDSSNLHLLAAAFTVAQLAIVAATLYRAKVAGMVGKTMSASVLKGVIQISLPFFLASALANSSGTIDMAVLSRLADFHEVAYYGAVMRIQSLFLLLIPLMASAVTPLLSSTYARDPEEYKQLASQAMRILMIFAFVFCMVNIAFGHEIIALIYGQEFAPAAKVIGLNGPVVLATYISIFLVHNIVVTTNGHGLVKIVFLGFLLNFGLDYLLIPIGAKWIGAGGGACGSMVATLITELINMGLLIRLSNNTVFNKRATYTLCMVGLATVAFGAASSLWFDLNIVTRVALFSLVIPIFLAATRLVTLSDLTEFKQLISRRGQT